MIKRFLFEFSLTTAFLGLVGMLLFGGTVVLAQLTLQPLNPEILSTMMSSITVFVAGVFGCLLLGRMLLE